MNYLFNVGDKIVCVDSSDSTGHLTEGKTYTVLGTKPCSHCPIPMVNIGVGVVDGCWHQTRFVPLDFDRQVDEAIHQALKEDLKVKNFQDN